MRKVNQDGNVLILSDSNSILGKFNTEEEADNYMNMYRSIKSYSSNVKKEGTSNAMKLFKKKIKDQNS